MDAPPGHRVAVGPQEDRVMSDSNDRYIPPADVREHARRCALAGKPVFVNPYIGDVAAEWFTAYREVPEEQRGSQPDLVRSRKTLHGKARTKASAAGVRALGDRCLPGSTPRPWGEL
jgi:hypothetical protein